MKEATHCYVAQREGEPGCYAACVDMPDLPKETAKFCAEVVEEGGFLVRVPIKEARNMLGEWYRWQKSRDAASNVISQEKS